MLKEKWNVEIDADERVSKKLKKEIKNLGYALLPVHFDWHQMHKPAQNAYSRHNITTVMGWDDIFWKICIRWII